jgi:heterodisulfide reductase subunit C
MTISAALNHVGNMVSACIQCGTCTASCPNTQGNGPDPEENVAACDHGTSCRRHGKQDFHPLLGLLHLYPALSPRTAPDSSHGEPSKASPLPVHEARHRSSRLFYEQFMQTVRQHGRLREMAFMTRFFTAMKSPVTPFRFAPLGLKLMGKGKVEMGFGQSADIPLDALFDRVAALERTPDEPTGKEGHG